MVGDDKYKNTASENRGKFTEHFTADRLVSVFGEKNVFQNVSIIKDGNTVGEIDVLVVFADRALVVQCKSKKLTLEARKGNDNQLKDDFGKSVQSSYDQAWLCSNFLRDTKAKFFDAQKSQIALDEYKEIYPICVVSDHYPALSVQAREFLKSETNNTVQSPLIADVFLIDAIAEMLTSPLRFLSYLNRRVNYGDRVNTVNELTILSYHLRQNLWIDSDFDLMTLDENIAIPLDTAMTVRREGVEGKHTPEGILTKFKGTLFERLIKSIENQPVPSLVDLGLMLLTLNEGTIAQLNNGISAITRQTKMDGEQHDLTLAFDEGKTGLTVHCNRFPNKKALKEIDWHCRLRKYAQKADSWFGLVVRVDDGMPKFGINLKFPWTQDDEYDENTKWMQTAGSKCLSGKTLKKKKIGRNEPCPCGSGLKYKKCCIDRLR